MPKLCKWAGGGVLLAALLMMVLPEQVCPQGGGSGVMTVPSHPEQVPGAAPRPSEPEGGLDIRLHPEEGKMQPAAELLVISPRGQKLGNDPRRHAVYREIPESYYEREGLEDAESGEPGPESGVIYISHPAPGTYTLQVIGSEAGKYTLELMGFFPENFSRAEFLHIGIRKGDVHAYAIDYPGPRQETIEVRRLR